MRKYLLFGLLFLFVIQIPISSNKIVIQNLNEKYGLAKKRVNCMFQDSKGFVWFGMVNGLYKFDQYSFTFFSSRKNKANGFPEADIRSIIELKPGILLIGTYDKGLLIYDAIQEKSFPVKSDSSIDLSKFNVKCLYLDKSDNIWIGTYNGLYRAKCMAQQTYKFKILSIYNKINLGLISNDFFEIKESKEGKIWFVTMLDIGYYNPQTSEIKAFHINFGAISSFDFIDNNRLLIGCYGSGLKILNTINNQIESFHISGISEKAFVKCVYKDKRSNFWLSITNVGLVSLGRNVEKPELLLLSNKNSQYSALNSNAIYQINETKEGNLWVCTEDGIDMITQKQDYFTSYPCNQNSGMAIGVRSLLDSKLGFIWVGTIGGGLKQFNLITKKFTDVPLVNRGKRIGNSIQTIMQDHKGDLWLGTEGEGVIRFHPDRKAGYLKGTTINYQIYPQSFPEHTLLNDFVMCFLEDRHRNIWIGTWYGLSLIDSADVESADQSKVVIQNFINNPSDSLSISNNTIMSLLEDKDGNIWVGTQGGLNKIEKTSTGYKFLHPYKNKNGELLTDRKVLCTYQSRNGKFWFSTQEGGISLFDPQTGTFDEFNSDNVFFDNIINSIAEDTKGNLWLGSNTGLGRLDQDLHSFINFTTDDGLISSDFLYGSRCKVGDDLCFGVNGGLVMFDPGKIVPLSFRPNLVFTEFRLFNKPVSVNDKNSPLEHQISYEKSVTLKHNQNFITISFTSLDFKPNEDIQYSCMMEGLETTWNYLKKEQRATYTNLAPGKYLFKVRAFSSNDYKNASEISLRIIVKPPFWKTFWAYLIYILLIVFALLQTYRYFLNKERRKNALTLERLNAKRIHELDLMRLQFFTNISHEFRTPLTLLSAPLESLIKDNPEPAKVQSYYQLMLKNVRRLTRLIDQLLDLRKIEEGYLKMEWVQGDMVEFIRKTFDTFQHYAQKRNMYFTFQSTCPELFTYFDPDKLDKILFNLFSNAFKYTGDYGSISLKLTVKQPGQLPLNGLKDPYLEIKLSDSGVGIPKESLSKLFKPFHQVNSNKPIGSSATGIGLSLTKELIDLHKGYITVESEIEKGSTFTVYLPIYKDNPIIVKEEIEKFEQQIQTAIQDSLIQTDEENHKGSKPLVLIVEDNSDLRTFLRDELQKSYRIIESVNGQEGLDQAIQNIPDLVVSDIMMEKMDGVELCRKLKNDERTSHIPVILLTARHSEDVKLSGYETGADDYIVKPFNTTILLTRIKNLIEQRRKLRSLFGKSNDVDSNLNTSKIDSKFIEKLNQVIDKNIDNPEFDPVELASEMCMSKMQLYRKVSALTNQTVYNYIRTVRLKKAAQLLVSTDMQISEIALSVGYTEPSNFTKCFIRQFNQTPSVYVRTNRK